MTDERTGSGVTLGLMGQSSNIRYFPGCRPPPPEDFEPELLGAARLEWYSAPDDGLDVHLVMPTGGDREHLIQAVRRILATLELEGGLL